MKQVVRFAVAGALMAGYATAQAQSLPSTNNSDLWVFVTDQTAGTTFAEDTGIAINTLLPTNQLAPSNTATSQAVLSTAISANFTVAASSALTSYISGAGTHTLNWGVEALQYTPNATGAPAQAAVPGSVKAITDNVASQQFNTSNMNLSNLKSWTPGWQGDASYLAQTYVAGGKSYAFTAGTSVQNVWGANAASGGGSTNLYSNGPEQLGIGFGQVATLYGLTGAGNTGQLQSYILGTNLTMSSAGVLSVSPGTSPIPIPAAVWLFGSGLLGLIGVGRRRAAAV